MASIAWAQQERTLQLPGITGEGAETREKFAETSSQEEEAPRQPQEPSPGSRPQPPPADVQMTEAQVKQRLKTVVSLAFAGANLRNVLNGLAKTYGLNIVVGEEVKGTVNITLRGVTLGEALKQILKLSGYTILWEGSIGRVVSLEEEVVTEILYINFVQPDVAMEFLKKEASESGVMKVDEVQSGILVTDKLSKVEAMKKILAGIDFPPQQVLIQAKLMDITHTDLDNLGLKLSSVSFDIPLRSNLMQALLNVSAGALDLSGPSADLTTDTVTATIAKGPETMTAAVDALIRDKRVKVLASPTVTTLNNVEAKITIGEKFPIKETTQTTTGTLQTTRFVDIGITLRVTPKINRAGFIQMQIHPEVSSVSSTIDAGPRITTREADTTVIIKDRESVIIAGLIKEDETLTKDRIPGLGHVPVLGILFQNRAKSYEQKELVIVITPYLMPVLPPQVASGSEVEELRQRLDATQLYYQAKDFEVGKTLQARSTPEELRILRAAELYESLADRFQSHSYAPEALWRAGEIRWGRFQDAFRAEEDWTRLMTQYPSHRLVSAARRRIKELQAYLERRQRKEEKEQGLAPKDSKVKRVKSTPRGPRKSFVPPGFH